MKRKTLNQRYKEQMEQKKKLQKKLQMKRLIMINAQAKRQKIPEEMAQGSKLFRYKESQK